MEIKGIGKRGFIVENKMNFETFNQPQRGRPALCILAQAYFFKIKINRIFGTLEFDVMCLYVKKYKVVLCRRLKALLN